MGAVVFRKGAYIVRCGVDEMNAKVLKITQPISLENCRDRALVGRGGLFAVRPRGSPSRWSLYHCQLTPPWATTATTVKKLHEHDDLDVIRTIAVLTHDL